MIAKTQTAATTTVRTRQEESASTTGRHVSAAYKDAFTLDTNIPDQQLVSGYKYGIVGFNVPIDTL